MPLLNFDMQAGMTAPETSELREVVAKNWQDAFRRDGAPTIDTDPSTPAGQLVDAETSYLSQLNSELLFFFSQLNPRTSEGPWQDALAAIYFLTRKIAQPTQVVVECTGLPGTVIPRGAQIRTGKNVRYECVQDTAIPASGPASVLFRGLEAGPIECPAHDLNSNTGGSGTIITVVPGWDTIDNPNPGVVGWDRESQWDFENRRYDSVAKNSHGAVESLQGAIWDVEDVVDCVVLENPTGAPITRHGLQIPAHSVAISVFGGDPDAIAEAIYLKKDAGCGTGAAYASGAALPERILKEIAYTSEEYGARYEYNIVRPETKDMFIKVTINKVASTPSNAAALIRAAILADFRGTNEDSGYRRIGSAQTVYASRFSIAVVKTAGIPDLVSIEIKFGGAVTDTTGWGSEVTVNAYEEPTLEDYNIVVNELTD